MVAEVEGDEALGHGAVDLEDGILRVAVVLGDIDVAEVGRLSIFAALLRLVGYLHGDGGEHLQRVAQLRVVARTDPQLLERHLDGHAAVLIELVAAEDIELARGAAVEHSLQDVLQALDDAHEDAHLHLAVVVAHHRHGNGCRSHVSSAIGMRSWLMSRLTSAFLALAPRFVVFADGLRAAAGVSSLPSSLSWGQR